jgi:hypothetical protein
MAGQAGGQEGPEFRWPKSSLGDRNPGRHLSKIHAVLLENAVFA